MIMLVFKDKNKGKTQKEANQLFDLIMKKGSLYLVLIKEIVPDD